jgi:hypothetical protein
VLLPGAVRDGPNGGEQFVRHEVPDCNSSGTAVREVQIEAGEVVASGYEGLSIAQRVNLLVGDGLVLVGHTVGAGAVRAEEHIPAEFGIRRIVIVVWETIEAPEQAAAGVRV